MDKFKFGEYIYNKRKTQGLTQEELGRKIGVTNKAVSKWEVGETCPDISMLAPLSKALGVTIDELLNYTDKEKVETTKKKNSFLMLLIIIALAVLEVTTLVFLIISLSDNGFKKIEVSNENIKEIVDINPSSKIEVDGETLVIGGLIQESEQKTVNKIPFLGDLPLIGPDFRSTSTTKSKNELVIMITPKILNDSEGAIADSL